jgi:hypothetical protein
MSTTTSLADTLTREREALLGTIAWLSDAALDQKGAVGERSIKDVLAHLATWERLALQTLRERLTAAHDTLPNHEQGPTRAATSPTEQVLEMERVRSDLLRLVADMDEDMLAQARPWPGWEGTVAEYILAKVCDHEREHHHAIRETVARLAPSAEYWPGVRASRELAIARTGTDAAD